MNFKKIIASVAAAALAVSAMAVNTFASTVALDSAYVGDWGSGASIAKTEFDAFEGDVKVVLTVETVNVKDGNSYLLKPMDKDKSWDAITSSLTAEKAVCKPDGWMQVKADQTEVEFVVPKAVKDELWNGGIGFQVNNLIIKSAELSDGAAENAFTIVSDADTPAYCSGQFDPWAVAEEAAPADEATTEAADATAADDTDEALDDTADVADDEVTADEADDDVAADDADVADDDAVVTDDAADEAVVDAPAADADTAAAATGNTSAAVIFSVMAVAGAAAIVAKKRK